MQNSSQLFEEKNKHAEDYMCNQCHQGHMKKIVHPHSFDFNKDGYVPRSCNNCGTCSDIEEIIKEVGTVTTPLSNNFIDNVFNCIFIGKKFDLKIRKRLVKLYKKKKFFSLYNFAYLIHRDMTELGFLVDMEFILKVIYTKYKPLHAYS